MSVDAIAAEVRANKEAKIAAKKEEVRAERIRRKEEAKRIALIEAFLTVNVIE